LIVEKIRIGVSSCLLGEKVRYDGGHKLDRYITETLGQYFEYIPVCPEVEYGLPTPRESLRLVGDPVAPRLVTVRTGVDHTEGMKRWAEGRLDQLGREEISGFIFKSRSPSSGLRDVKIYPPSGIPTNNGVGLFAVAFVRRNPLTPVIDDGRLHDPGLRETFIDAVSVFRRWHEFMREVGDSERHGGPKKLVALHTDLKYMILAHSPKHYTMLGRLVATAGLHTADDLAAYGRLLMEGLRLHATRPKNTNVLLHIAGYFKKHLSADEKEELLGVIGGYHKGYVPLIVPVTLINHYVRKYDEPYLKRQVYLNPHPIELMLRNHV
jgi:uncharacterized protein YbgA (DUF1722 family)/uncharacterized protein YbbK (DUF523 family)